MAYEQVSLKEYYHLKKDNFSIDPWVDSAQYFGASELGDRIRLLLETNFVSPGGVPKFFVHGSYGSGKTHTLAYIQHVLTTDEDFTNAYATEPIFLDVAPLSAKESWKRIHNRLLDAIGPDRISEAAEAVADKWKTSDKVAGFLETSTRWGDQALRNSQANVFRNMLFGGKQAQMSWDWMKGQKVSPDQAQVLGTQKNLSEAQEFVNCLLNIGLLYREGNRGKKIVFLMDEGEAFRDVTNPDSISEITHAYRMLLETHNDSIGLITATQADGGMESVPAIFGREDIRRRVGNEQGYVDVNSIVQQVDDARVFVKQVIEYLVDLDGARKVVESEGLQVPPELFPFEPDAVEHLVELTSSDLEHASPARVIRTMSDAAIDRWRERGSSDVHVTVDSDSIERAAYVDA